MRAGDRLRRQPGGRVGIKLEEREEPAPAERGAATRLRSRPSARVPTYGRISLDGNDQVRAAVTARSARHARRVTHLLGAPWRSMSTQVLVL